jgi:hypothetical protein
VEIQGEPLEGGYDWTAQREAAGASSAPQR